MNAAPLAQSSCPVEAQVTDCIVTTGEGVAPRKEQMEVRSDLMEDEVVRRRRSVNREKFLDLLGAANLIPGQSSTEMAIFIGYPCRGWAGLLLGGVCFIIPAIVIVIGFAWAYMQFGSFPQVTWLLYGVKPVVIAIILQALWQLGRTAIKNRFLGALALVGIILNLAGINILAILFGTGMFSGTWQGLSQERSRNWRSVLIMLAAAGSFLAAAHFATGLYSTGKVSFGLLQLFLFFVKVGSIVFGSGYVLLAFLQADLVAHWHWLTTTQLLGAIAVGQVTLGPVFTSATFFGYLLARLPVALIATAGIFLPSFILVAVVGPLIPGYASPPWRGPSWTASSQLPWLSWLWSPGTWGGTRSLIFLPRC